ncbi:UPF0149 family protein [Cognatilysobacter lacus]|uniref:UPF0149 family protein n=1 Tax=Cognatilysobacter lacus TaxID=1643323 RepID=A0A5D8YXG3_9GAMM|nr:UPF0149 family protein [Lysobacter lacus]TZF87139.1 UPF0149 family protein [Lysobacter lacus]
MAESDLPSAADIDAEAVRFGLASTPYELHGALCGWLCGGGRDAAAWLAHVLADDTLPMPPSGSPLDRLREATAAQLSDRSFEFELLLPDADEPLAERSGALFDWCRGFVGAFGLASGANAPLSEESREALADIAKLAAAQPQEDGDEEDEQALVEIEEFVRVAALLMHGDCVLAPEHRQRLN